MSTAAPITVDQSDDFLTFVLDGKPIEVDIYEASDRLSAIDLKHRNDLDKCLDCQAEFKAAELKCPKCGSENCQPNQSFLDDVAAMVKSYGALRCGRRAAGQFYQAVTEAIAGLKKNAPSTPISPCGSTDSTLRDGAALESEHS
jgi:hypothetical protein